MWLGSMGIVTLRSVARPNCVVTSSLSPVTLRPSATFVTRHCLGNVSKRVEDVMPIATGHELQHGMRFSTSVPNDPDTHDDFKPTNKLENSGVTLKDIVKQDVKDNYVMIYMKGDPEQPRCGFSSLAVRVLSEYRVPIHSRNILEDPELKNAVKAFST
ncbi:hypothetical protein L6452_30161 [Arctium lappa]|uniref:Uncharacterized protein n=1 Tax=Arctium lappa TaxID=4217 RepID=A0ACB8ZGY9_ARCLA|nr:hypothetical protein L6452_30161 [Arctium lappa]